MESPLLKVENLTVDFNEKIGNDFRALNNISLKIYRGEIFGLIGESGAGKTVLAHSIMGLLEGYPGIINGKIMLNRGNLLEGLPLFERNKENIIKRRVFRKWRKKHQHTMKGICGIKIGMIFQEPFKSMDPLFTVREHIIESLKNSEHLTTDGKNNDLVINWLKSAQMENPEEVQNKYVFELSGGMIQRVMIAVALASKPLFLIADEPTTSLDTITQKKILDLLYFISKNHDLSLLFITHDSGIAAHYFDRFGVIINGKIVEVATKNNITMSNWFHPYTEELLKAFKQNVSDEFGRYGGYTSYDISGCIFEKRCKYKNKFCSEKDPPLIEVEKDHFIRCWKYQ